MIEDDSGNLHTEQRAISMPSENGRAKSRASVIEVSIQLARRKRFIAMVTAVSSLIGTLVSFLLPTLYTSSAKILTPQQTQSTVALMMNQLANSGSGTLAAAAGGGLGLRNPDDVYLGMLRSRPIADALIRQFSLMNIYRVSDMTAARKKLAAETSVATEKGGFISVSIMDKDRQRASDIANAYIAELRRLMTRLAVTEAAQRRVFYEEQLKGAKDDLVAAEFAFQQVQQRKGLVQLDVQTKASIEGLAALNAQVAAKQVELQALRSYSTENNPEVQLAEGQLRSLQLEAAGMEKQRSVTGTRALGLQDVAGGGLEYLRAQHELQYRQIMFDLLLKQYDAARLDEAKDAAVIQVVEPATVSEHRSSPQRTSLIVRFAVLGFLGACAYAFLSKVVLNTPEVHRSLLELRSAMASR